MFSRFQLCLKTNGSSHFKRIRFILINKFVNSSSLVAPATANHSFTIRHKSNDSTLSSLIKPLPVKFNVTPDEANVGAELVGNLNKDDLMKLLTKFYRQVEIKKLAAERGLDNRLFHQAYISFRKYVLESENLSVDFHVVLSDILNGSGHIDDIFPYFLKHSREIFPHLDCMEDLKKISDLRLPANWYPEARALQRKIIFHAGPTNSGKTYHALERFFNAKSGVYCGPLKLLANEVFKKSNDAGTPCDLVTGEERRQVDPEGNQSNHVSCTVEMTSINTPYEVAVIDEIQMIKDSQRGWAWTRALLGVCAKEVHVCGEASAIDLIKELMMATCDEVEVYRYKRLTKLTYLDKPVGSFDKVRPGDCIVCFSKKDIYHVSTQLEKRGHEVAVIYGGLPPGTKIAQSKKFNDPNDRCKIMVATDAIGMGLNLSIKRVIFYTLIKPCINEKGEKEMDFITTSQALQIGGRAGRFGTEYENGEVTTFRREDIPLLKEITSRMVEPIEQAGLHPTADQIELFAYHLPKATLSNLVDIFITLSEMDNNLYFMCNLDDFKFLADMIEHVPLPLRVRYVFCCSPIPKKQPFVCSMFLKFARVFSRGEPLTFDWLCRQIGWPFQIPSTILDLVHLEGVFDVLDLYLWLRYRFPDMFPDYEQVRDMQEELDKIIQKGVVNITGLLLASETKRTRNIPDDDEFEIRKISRKNELSSSKIELDTNENVLEDSEDEEDEPRSVKERFAAAKGKRGRVSEKLIKAGILTPEMLQNLKKEILENLNNDESSNKNS